jgi:branched-chain amino acid transport system ATP-binding protein
MSLLVVDNITKRFGGLTAVSEFSLTIEKGELVGLIGPNGAGKTTCFNMITRTYLPTSGSIRFLDTEITEKKTHEVTALGIARTFQNIRLFHRLSVFDNVRVGFHLRLRSNVLSSVFGLPGYRREDAEINRRTEELLETVGLWKFRNELSGSLPYGHQRKLEIARALATGPRLLLLDEPAAGMNPEESSELMVFIRRLQREFGLTILLIEHDMKVVMGICERLAVLDHGLTIARGTPEEIQNNTQVIEAYLGTGEHNA